MIKVGAKAAVDTASADGFTGDLLIGHHHDLKMFHWFIRAHLKSASGAIPEK
jgi:starvation-inducible DNA-binding protein